MAIELIKISEFPQVSEPGDWIVVSDAAGTGYKISKEDFKEWLGTVTVITDKPIALSDPAPTLDGVYLPTEPGTYTNAGGLVYDPEGVDAGKYVQFIKNDAAWTKLEVDLPQAENKIPDWTAGTYAQGDQRIHNGQIWTVDVASTTEEPGTGTDWVGDIDKIALSDIETEIIYSETNLLDPSYAVRGKAIDSSGNIVNTTEANVIIRDHPATQFAGNAVTLDGIKPDSFKKWVFRDGGGIVVGGVSDLSVMPKIRTAPADAVTMDLTLKRGIDPEESFAEARISLGTVSLPYEPFMAEYVTEIKGKKLKGSGGTAYDQSLNTYDDVTFKSVTAEMNITAFSFDLPVGSGTPPAEVAVGDAWLDNVDGSVKIRLS